MKAALLTTTLVATLVGAAIASGASAGRGTVLVIGDSLEVGTAPYLRRELSGVAVRVDARTSRPSGEGVRVLRNRLRSDDAVAVFDLGVNDGLSQPEVLARDLSAVRELAGDRCLVVATLSRPPQNGVSIVGLNAVIHRFVSETPGAQLVDWRASAASHPELVGPDGVHSTPAGYAFRARLVAEAVEACLTSGPAPPRAEPRTPRSRSPRAGSEEPGGGAPLFDIGLSDLRRLTPYDAVLTYLRGAARLLASVGQDVRYAVGGASPEPVLGAP
jgi:hypothetical protein